MMWFYLIMAVLYAAAMVVGELKRGVKYPTVEAIVLLLAVLFGGLAWPITGFVAIILHDRKGM